MVSNPLLLYIDTALTPAKVAIFRGSEVLAQETCLELKDQAPWLQPAIGRIFNTSGLTLREADAIAVCAGPGSYTGLRIGLASAKGLCFALKKPLILLNTLQVMAAAMLPTNRPGELLCPQIDARRMEVFTALYDAALTELMPPQALIINEESYSSWLEQHKIRFFGSGSEKCKGLLKSPAALFVEQAETLAAAGQLALESFVQQGFADLATAEPFYVKAFYTPARAN